MLKYTGQGFIVGIPGRDLTDAEVKKYGREWLIRSGLYKDPEIVPPNEIAPSYKTRKKKLENNFEEADKTSAEVN